MQLLIRKVGDILRNAIDVIIKDMNEGIKADKEERCYLASRYIDDVMDYQEIDVNERLELIREIEIFEVRELLYEHYITNLSQDLFYEKSK